MIIKKLMFFGLSLLIYTTELLSQSSKTVRSNWSIDPDSYSISLQKIKNKWNSKAGGEFFVPIIKNDKLEIKTSLGGFIDINNFTENESFSWEIWRGSFGGSLFFNLTNQNWLPKNSSVEFQLSYSHESQHASNVSGYINKYIDTRILKFNNGSIRSFEYLKFATKYNHRLFDEKLLIPIKLGYKHFPTPILENTDKMLTNAFFMELGIQWELKKYLFLYSSFYFENINNNYDFKKWGYLKDLNGEDLKYRLMETGLVFKNKKEQNLGVYFYYSNSNGRGLDFVDTINGFGVGTRIVL